MAKLWAILHKDMRSEYRTRYAVNSLLLFALVTLTALSFATAGAGVTPLLAGVFYWVILFFSALSSLAQTFIKETETKTEAFLKLTAPTDAVFFGKWAFNLLLILLLEIVLTPLFIVMLNMTVSHWGIWVGVLVLGAVGLVSTTTLLGALIASANVRGALFSVLAFPVLLPLLVTAIRASEVCFGGGTPAVIGDAFLVLGAYAVVATTAAWLLFPFVWRD
ncbi:MAG TPA: heme exporter protein CcmB [Acidobacteriota bacterium]|nr:heme exporter protein CcmB [Acidobacteriota bacterium]